jgi:hypothetical protein
VSQFTPQTSLQPRSLQNGAYIEEAEETALLGTRSSRFHQPIFLALLLQSPARRLICLAREAARIGAGGVLSLFERGSICLSIHPTLLSPSLGVSVPHWLTHCLGRVTLARFIPTNVLR